MTLTNMQSLPAPLVAAMENDDYTKGDADYSVTELIAPPQLVLLRQRHKDEIVEDASDVIWRFLGKTAHKVAEQAEADNGFQEERLFAEINGRKISGATDLTASGLSTLKITDYKLTSVYTRIYGSRIDEWEAQQNIYAWLWARHGYGITALEICAIYRDWRPADAKRTPDYPPKAEIIPLRLWSTQEQEDFICEKLDTLIAYEQHSDDTLPPCTDDEMWAKPDTWAVMKAGRKFAVRVLESEDEAQDIIAAQTKGEHHIEHRLGQRTRCESYCEVAPFCHQWKTYQEAT